MQGVLGVIWDSLLWRRVICMGEDENDLNKG